MRPGSLQKRAEALKAPRTTDSNDRPHDRREVPRCDHHQVPLRNAGQPSQPRPSCTAGDADMSERSFSELAAKPAELLASRTPRASPCGVDGSLLGRILVRPATLLRRGTLRDVGPKPVRMVSQVLGPRGSLGPRFQQAPVDALGPVSVITWSWKSSRACPRTPGKRIHRDHSTTEPERCASLHAARRAPACSKPLLQQSTINLYHSLRGTSHK